MSFLAPLLLLAAVAAAVPILLHLFRRRDSRVHAFPALRYLRQTTRERARIVRLRQLLLLALRVGAIVLLVLAAARWVLPLGGGDQPPAGVVLVIDNGLTSAQVVDDRRVLDHLLDRARIALDLTGDLDRIWVLAAGEPWRPAFPMNRHEARARLDEIQPVATRADLGRSVARARALLEAGAPELREILLLSDLNGALLARPTEPAPEGTPDPGEDPGGIGTPEPEGYPAGDLRVVVGTIDRTLPPNRGLAAVEVGGGIPPRAGIATEVALEVAGEPVGDQAVRLFVGDQLVTAGRTDGGGRALLALPPQPAGWVVGRAELDPDPLRADDVRWFALPVRHPPRVRPAEPLPRFIQAAIEVLADRQRIVLDGTGSGAGRTPVGIEAEGLGVTGLRPTLIFAPSDPAVLPATNRRLAELGTGWRLAPIPEGEAQLRTLDEDVPSLRLPAGIAVHRSYPLEPLAGGRTGSVRARLSDGTPWIVQFAPATGDVGQPGVILVTSPPDQGSSDLPVSAAMIPFLAAALEILDGGEPALRLTAGDPLPLPAATRAVVTPEGTRVPADGISPFHETGRAGIYDLLDDEGQVLTRVAVNPRPVESGDGARLTSEAAAARLGPGAVATSGSLGWRRATLAERRGREVWRPLLAAALLLLLVETLLAATGRTGDGTRARRDANAPSPPASPSPVPNSEPGPAPHPTSSPLGTS